MSLTGIFDEAFDLYKRNFLLFVGICAVTNVPWAVFLFAFPYRSGIWSWVSGGVWGVLSSISNAAVVWAVSTCYLERKPRLEESYKAILPILGPLVLTGMLAEALKSAGLVLCFVPGIVILIWIAFLSNVVAIERTMYLSAIKRSRALAAGQWGRIVASFLLVSGVTSLVYFAFVVPTDMIVFGSVKYYPMPREIVPILARVIPTMVIAPAYSIVYTLLYYDIRVRKEGFDIEVLARNMAGETVAPKKSKVKA